MARYLLAADVGGTKTDLAVVSSEAGPRRPLAKRRYSSAAYAALADMARSFLDEVGLTVEAVCVDVAGPVVHREAQLTNLRWRLDEPSLAEAMGVERAWLLNDLVATAVAIPLLQPDEVRTVKEGDADPDGVIAVLAPGTGLGEAYLVPGVDGYTAHPSEGQHAAFAPSSEQELELLRTLWRTFDHVSVERVASGIGIPNLYEFLRLRAGTSESPELARRLAQTDDRTRPILEAALAGAEPDPLAGATVELFLRILGGEAAKMVLTLLATGGVYLAGGIAQALQDELAKDPFLDAFMNVGRFRTLLDRVPVFLVLGDVALLGAASEGLRRLEALTARQADAGRPAWGGH